MKALTIKQPWASMIAEGLKDVEYRSWPPPVDAIGQDLAVHAGSGSSDSGFKLLEDAVKRPVDRTGFPASAVLAVVRLEGAVPGQDGGWEWLLRDVRRLDEPVECSGKLRVWTLPSDVEDEVRRRLGAGEFERTSDASSASAPPSNDMAEPHPSSEAFVQQNSTRVAMDDSIAGWVVKGVRREMPEESWKRWLTPGYRGAWWTRKSVKKIQADLPVFFFKGAPASVLIGEGRMTGASKLHADDFWEVGIEATRPFPVSLSKAALQKHPDLGTASFLKIGPVGTFYPLTVRQVAAIRALAFSLPA